MQTPQCAALGWGSSPVFPQQLVWGCSLDLCWKQCWESGDVFSVAGQCSHSQALVCSPVTHPLLLRLILMLVQNRKWDWITRFHLMASSGTGTLQWHKHWSENGTCWDPNALVCMGRTGQLLWGCAVRGASSKSCQMLPDTQPSLPAAGRDATSFSQTTSPLPQPPKFAGTVHTRQVTDVQSLGSKGCAGQVRIQRAPRRSLGEDFCTVNYWEQM